MKKGIFLTLLITLNFSLCDSNLVFAQATKSLKTSELQGINFRQKGEVSEIELVFDNNEVDGSRFHVSEDKQIIIDVKKTKATEKVLRDFDTSEFTGSIVFVSAYPKPDSPTDLRIAIQLRDNVRSVLKRQSNRLVLEVENRFGVFNQNDVRSNQSYEEKVNKEKSTAGKLLIPKSEAVEDILENLTLSGRKKYIGKKISLNVKDISVEDLLKMIAEASGFNIILTKEVKTLATLTLNLTNVNWDQALDTILGLNKLVAKKNGIILMIQTLKAATKDAQDEAKARNLAIREEPLVTKIFPISYANIEELDKILAPYLTEKRGAIAQDTRTNALIIKDTPEIIEKLRKIIEVLDTQTPQVLIESKIVEVNEGYAKEIGLSQGFNFGYDPVGTVTNADPSTVGVGGTGGTDFGPGFSFSSAPASDADAVRSVFGLAIGRFGRLTNLNFTLQLLESESKAKVLSSPKVVTQNKKKATLKAKRTEVYRTVTGTAESQEVDFDNTEVNLSLTVTPQVTNEGSISLEIEVVKEDFGTTNFVNGPPNITGSEVQSNVLVENGSTIVLGGIYEYATRETHSGVPFLKDIPLIGWLFRTPYAPSTTKREVIIFITPRIINQEEAGLVDQV